jgi:hypothetical protein
LEAQGSVQISEAGAKFVDVLGQQLIGIRNTGVKVAEAVVPVGAVELKPKKRAHFRGGMQMWRARVARQVILEQVLREPRPAQLSQVYGCKIGVVRGAPEVKRELTESVLQPLVDAADGQHADEEAGNVHGEAASE